MRKYRDNMAINELLYYGNNVHMPLVVGWQFTWEELRYINSQQKHSWPCTSLNCLPKSKTLTIWHGQIVNKYQLISGS